MVWLYQTRTDFNSFYTLYTKVLFSKITYRVVCPNSGHPALTSSVQVYVLCRCCKACYENNKSPFGSWNYFKTDDCCTNIFLLLVFIFFKWRSLGRVSEVRAHFPICIDKSEVLFCIFHLGWGVKMQGTAMLWPIRSASTRTSHNHIFW